MISWRSVASGAVAVQRHQGGDGARLPLPEQPSTWLNCSKAPEKSWQSSIARRYQDLPHWSAGRPAPQRNRRAALRLRSVSKRRSTALRKRQSSKLVGSMTTSRMVIPRGRVSMNITILATSLASIRQPDSFTSFNFSSGQSVRSALMTLRDRLRAEISGWRAVGPSTIFCCRPLRSRGQAKS